MPPSPRIMIVEDNPMNMKLFSILLEENGCDVRKAFDGHDFIAKVKAAKPDLILMDIVLPGASGLDLLEELRKDAALSPIPVIGISASWENGKPDDRSIGGFDGCMNKPITVSSFAQSVLSYLRGDRDLSARGHTDE